MKHIVKISLAAAAMFSLAACDNSDYELDNLIPDKYKRVVCIQNEPKADLELFDVGMTLDTKITILRSGGDPSLEAATSLVPMTAEELAEFNVDYKLLDPSLYSTDTNISFAANERNKVVPITFTSEAVKDIKENCNDGTYYLALKLVQQGETSINGDKYYILRRIVVKDATIDFGLSSGLVNLSASNPKFTVSLPFTNTDFNIAWDMEITNTFDNDTESTELGNSLPAKYARKGLPMEALPTADVKTMDPGTNSVTYEISMPEGTPYGVYWLSVKMSNPTLNEMPIASTKGDVEALIRYEYMPEVSVTSLLTALNGSATPLDRTGWKFVPESQMDSNPGSLVLDGDTSGNFWENRWGGGGYGTYSLPFNAVLDMASTQKINVLEPWRRPGSYVTDTRTIEIYAAESADYSNKESIQYESLTYLGTVEFGNSSNNNQAQLFALDPVETRYLIMRFTGSNRGGSCISLAEIGAWTTE